jgi:murein DD-endopeptidase MepM/ murein hydrolase activator NlpD
MDTKRYGHLSKYSKAGQKVKQGDIIGYVEAQGI